MRRDFVCSDLHIHPGDFGRGFSFSYAVLLNADTSVIVSTSKTTIWFLILQTPQIGSGGLERTCSIAALVSWSIWNGPMLSGFSLIRIRPKSSPSIE
ncbi:hypothetical protein BpHYR1_028045 [Brachionus plicatilis]|uniref:Uncharacterized protein n=1 Tax=Brachionus plicatilis TaxID=10195 RepID=A0A3M7SBC2_BRAPC|nr:hypothetical protein BpHYR1_028045 [Brachionus plicatilis]